MLQIESAPSRGLWALRTPDWAAQQNEKEVLLKTKELGVNMLQFVQSPTQLSHITLSQLFRINCERYIFLKKCVRSSLLCWLCIRMYMYTYSWLWLCNRCISEEIEHGLLSSNTERVLFAFQVVLICLGKTTDKLLRFLCIIIYKSSRVIQCRNSSLRRSFDTISTRAWGYKKFHTFPTSNSQKVNVITRLDFKLAYFAVTILYSRNQQLKQKWALDLHSPLFLSWLQKSFNLTSRISVTWFSL